MVYGFNDRGKLINRQKNKYNLEIIFSKNKKEQIDFIKYEIGMIIKNIEFKKETIIVFTSDCNRYILDEQYDNFVNFFVFDSVTKKSGFYYILDFFDKVNIKTWIFIDDIDNFDDIARATVPHLNKNNFLTITTTTFNPFLEKAYDIVFNRYSFQIIWLKSKITSNDYLDIKKLSKKIIKSRFDLLDIVTIIRKNLKEYSIYIISDDIEEELDINEKNLLLLHSINLESKEFWKEKAKDSNLKNKIRRE